MSERTVVLDDRDIALLRGWYGVMRGNGYAHDDDMPLAKKLFGGWPCDCGRDRERVGDCWSCEDSA